MKKIIFISATLSTILFACTQNNSSAPINKDSTSISKTDVIDSPASAEEMRSDSTYAYIKKVYQKNDSSFIDADYIQFLTGKAAIEAAKKNHEADTSYDKNGKIEYIGVPDDYYIVNQNKKIRTLSLGKDVRIETIDMSSGNVETKKMTVKEFTSKGLKNGLPFILKMKNNEVNSISEVFLP